MPSGARPATQGVAQVLDDWPRGDSELADRLLSAMYYESGGHQERGTGRMRDSTY